jgi:hypothetical protein
MSSTFANLLVRRRSGAPTTDTVAAAVAGYFRSRGWVKSSAGEPLRGVAIVTSGEWVVVYDSAIEQFAGGDEQHDLASVLSLEAKGLVVATLVSISDNLMMGLYEKGEQTCFVKRTPEGCELPQRLLSAWMKRFRGRDPRAFAKALAVGETFAEDNLRNAASALGLPNEVSTGYRYALEAGALDRATRLGFGLPELRTPDRAKLGAVNAEDVACAAGATTVWEPTFRNFGAAFDGLHVEVAGDAVAAGHVEPTVVAVRVGERDVSALLQREGRVFVGALADVRVPAGVPVERLDQLKLVSFRAWSEVAMPCLLRVAIDLAGKSAGAAPRPWRSAASAEAELEAANSPRGSGRRKPPPRWLTPSRDGGGARARATPARPRSAPTRGRARRGRRGCSSTSCRRCSSAGRRPR